MKYFLTLLLLYSFSIASDNLSLKGLTKTMNSATNTIDTKEVLIKVSKDSDKFNFKTLKKDQASVNTHIQRVLKIQENLKELSNFRTKLELNYFDIQQLSKNIIDAKRNYNRDINKIYKQNKELDRYSYHVITYPAGDTYTSDLESYIIDKYSIKKYDQSTTLKKSLASTDMKSIIKTEKDFGQKKIDIVYEYIFRANNIIFKIVKVTQNPFVKSNKTTSNKAIDTKIDQFAESKISIYDLNTENFFTLIQTLENKFNFSTQDMQPFIDAVESKIDRIKVKIDFKNSTKKIKSILTKLEKTHIRQAQVIIELESKFTIKKDTNILIESKLNQLLLITQKLLKPYKIPLTRETIGNLSIITPKTYVETVELNEENEYIQRKVKSYISKVNISDLKQSDTLIDFSDLSTTTTSKQKSIKFETIHTLPYLKQNNQIGLLIFTSISIKDDLTEDDLLSFDFKYDTIKFIPVKKGYKTIFVAQTKVSLGIVKEFLETNSAKRYFDQYCIDNSDLPEEAKNFKTVDEEFYNYPAICFKVDKIEKFTKWISEKTQRDIIVPDVSDWSYVATNSDTTDYCWGNQSPEELIEEEILPENIYLENNEEYSTISKLATYPKSKTGIYDMCGNVFELVIQEEELAYKGNSFSSYIGMSSDEGEEYSDDVNPTLGLRLFYIKDLTNE
ncbi:MAG: SUMF1/EgtB/PvdO family nonheme iron enzyme [Arcobacteraceae bacterium]|nr:SUMF1/EgtB/PvdO family nonheme iron enzyme [Arcobacteraceae bacterium]